MKPVITLQMSDPRPYEERRCCSDDPLPRPRADRTGTTRRWSQKLRVAVPSAFAVFRRTVASPVEPRVAVGTRVVTNRGRDIGRVQNVLVELPHGSTTYAIKPDDDPSAPVLLLPREAIRPGAGPNVAMVDERSAALRRGA
jgi:hypothetical protein